MLVLALPRGGVPVAVPVAAELAADLDVCVVRKLGVPGHEELAMGALASGGIRVLDEKVIGDLGVTVAQLEQATRRESAELDRREFLYRAGRDAVSPTGRTVVLVDDGLATGSTMRAAVVALRQRDPAMIVVAVPVAPPSTCRRLCDAADEVVCLLELEPFVAVGAWYRDFSAVSDADVCALLESAKTP